jgi:hypothetical protein
MIEIFDFQKASKMPRHRPKMNVFPAISDLWAFSKNFKHEYVLLAKHYTERNFEQKQILSVWYMSLFHFSEHWSQTTFMTVLFSQEF